MNAKIIACFTLSAAIWGSALVLVGTAAKDAMASTRPPVTAAATATVG